jgi:heme/copper-type cytochrome/quinol oxidase subunit 3
MADNTGEGHLDNLTNNQSENPTDEIMPINEKASVKSNQEIENMEVHHHAHHEEKRNWKSYFREFLMLFLAVFCGFLAEYQLEQTIERHREKELIESLIVDLKRDTAALNQAENTLMRNKLMMDSLIFFLTASNVK